MKNNIKFIPDSKDYKLFLHSITDVPKGYGQYNNSSGWCDSTGSGMGEGDGNYTVESGEGYGIDEEQGIYDHGTGEGDGYGDGSGWENKSGDG